MVSLLFNFRFKYCLIVDSNHTMRWMELVRFQDYRRVMIPPANHISFEEDLQLIVVLTSWNVLYMDFLRSVQRVTQLLSAQKIQKIPKALLDWIFSMVRLRPRWNLSSFMGLGVDLGRPGPRQAILIIIGQRNGFQETLNLTMFEFIASDMLQIGGRRRTVCSASMISRILFSVKSKMLRRSEEIKYEFQNVLIKYRCLPRRLPH